MALEMEEIVILRIQYQDQEHTKRNPKLLILKEEYSVIELVFDKK